ncbi:hypothetical protein AFLA_003263 [Aspergillus flavus NRRL3357]|nr:hypothetical protein AFLA_003263 [Aspergillus flavus NRRL3357]
MILYVFAAFCGPACVVKASFSAFIFISSHQGPPDGHPRSEVSAAYLKLNISINCAEGQAEAGLASKLS